jgi:hypothetical protein
MTDTAENALAADFTGWAAVPVKVNDKMLEKG